MLAGEDVLTLGERVHDGLVLELVGQGQPALVAGVGVEVGAISFMPPNSVFSIRWIWASSSLERMPSAQAANLISTSRAVLLPV